MKDKAEPSDSAPEPPHGTEHPQTISGRITGGYQPPKAELRPPTPPVTEPTPPISGLNKDSGDGHGK